MHVLWQLVGQDILQNDCWRLYLFINFPICDHAFIQPFKNCAYYGSYGVLVGYFVNHPLYIPPMFGDAQVYTGLALFLAGSWIAVSVMTQTLTAVLFTLFGFYQMAV